MIIFLIGFMGSGKSTTGKKLAKRLGYGFLDTDKMIVERFGMSINEIFETLGEGKFRETEASLLGEIVLKKNLVVSTGGGLPCYGNNMDTINRYGISIYLKAGPEELYERLITRKYKRPLIKDLPDEELRKFIALKLTEREPYYNRATHVVPGLDIGPGELVKLVMG
jgi:shikimate kinase